MMFCVLVLVFLAGGSSLDAQSLFCDDCPEPFLNITYNEITGKFEINANDPCPALPDTCETGYEVCGCCKQCRLEEGANCTNAGVPCKSGLRCTSEDNRYLDYNYRNQFDTTPGTCQPPPSCLQQLPENCEHVFRDQCVCKGGEGAFCETNGIPCRSDLMCIGEDGTVHDPMPYFGYVNGTCQNLTRNSPAEPWFKPCPMCAIPENIFNQTSGQIEPWNSTCPLLPKGCETGRLPCSCDICDHCKLELNEICTPDTMPCRTGLECVTVEGNVYDSPFVGVWYRGRCQVPPTKPTPSAPTTPDTSHLTNQKSSKLKKPNMKIFQQKVKQKKFKLGNFKFSNN